LLPSSPTPRPGQAEGGRRTDLLAALSIVGVRATTVGRTDHPRGRQPRKPAPWPQEDLPIGRSLAVGTEDWKCPRVEVDVTPPQAGHLAAAQPGERELPRDRIPAAVDVFEDLLQLRRRGPCSISSSHSQLLHPLRGPVATDNQTRGPLLVISGTEDHTVPDVTTRSTSSSTAIPLR
jgi:hypothetical protein